MLLSLMRVIDFHTHAFPDPLAERAVPQLAEAGGIRPVLDGRVTSLLASMDANGIRASVIASIATRPEQFEPILAWSRSVASDRIFPFASVHPEDPDGPTRIRRIADAGLKGIKLHPYYQDFDVDEPRMDPLYHAIDESGLVLLLHAGFDIAYERRRCCDPRRTANLARRHPSLKLVAAHLGGWQDWDEVRRHLLGGPVTLDLSTSLEFLPPTEARDLILAHPLENVVFGTDSPWCDQAQTLRLFEALDLPDDRRRAILHDNAARLLGLD